MKNLARVMRVLKSPEWEKDTIISITPATRCHIYLEGSFLILESKPRALVTTTEEKVLKLSGARMIKLYFLEELVLIVSKIDLGVQTKCPYSKQT